MRFADPETWVPHRRGVNVIGYLRGELGLGEVGRKLVAAAERAAIPTSTLTYTNILQRQEHQFQDRGRGDAPYDTNILCVNADQLPLLRRDVGPDVVAGRYSIGVWFWEIAHFPANLHSSFDLVDEVWVASDFVRGAIAAETSKPVHIVPIPLEQPPASSLGRKELGLPENYLFLFMFDYYSVNARKNPIGVVEAFKRAFGEGEGPSLLIKSINGEHRRDALSRLQDAARGRSDIRILDGFIAAPDKNALMAACDCYVSLHRSEGLGLTMAEAMSFGKPVIATGYSGNLTFMDERNSYLIRYAPTTVPPGAEPYVPGVEWAEPDLDHAVELMKFVYERPEEAQAVGARARADLLERHSLDRTADFLRRRLNEIPHRERLLLQVRGPLDHAAAIVKELPGESLGVRRKDSFFTSAIRKLLRRMLWPELAEQRRLDAALVESVQALERLVGKLVERGDNR